MWFWLRVFHESGCQPGPQSSEGRIGAARSASMMAHPHGSWPLIRGHSSLPLAPSIDCLSVFMMWQLASLRSTLLREKKQEATVPFMTKTQVIHCHFHCFSEDVSY